MSSKANERHSNKSYGVSAPQKLSLRSLNKWYGVFAPQYYEFSQGGGGSPADSARLSISTHQKVDLVQGLKAAILTFVGSVIGVPEGAACSSSHAETITPFTGCMDQLLGIWQVPIWQDVPIWVSASVSCIAKQ